MDLKSCFKDQVEVFGNKLVDGSPGIPKLATVAVLFDISFAWIESGHVCVLVKAHYWSHFFHS